VDERAPDALEADAPDDRRAPDARAPDELARVDVGAAAAAGSAGAASGAAARNPERSMTVPQFGEVQVNVAGGRSGSLNFFEHVGH